ncbi:MAG: hypothetical protein AB7E24_23290 [Novosphingobium sp.]
METEATDLETLIAAVGILFPDRAKRSGRSRRRIVLQDERDLTVTKMAAATRALSDPGSDRYVDAEVVDALLVSIGRHTSDDDGDMVAALIAHVDRRWSELMPGLAAKAVNGIYDRARIFAAFPRLLHEPTLLSMAIAAIVDPQNYCRPDELLSFLKPATPADARRLIDALAERARAGERTPSALTLPLFAAIGRGQGWSPWVALQTLLRACPDYAEPNAIFEKTGDPNRESQTTIDARLEVAQAIAPLTELREVAAILLQLVGPSAGWGDESLLSRPAEVRAAYVDTLRAAIGDDSALRQAVIEALLWSGDGRVAELAHYAAVAIADAGDRAWLVELETHPVRMVRYAARAVRAAKFGEALTVPALPVATGLIQSVAAMEGSTNIAEEPARTWLGDRAAERLIERTISAVEMRAAKDYESHGDEGEDRLLASLFTTLALRFADLDQALEALARAASAPNRAAVTMRYRNVDRGEEGDKGVRGAKKFAADLCLIVDPILEGVSLGRRVTLVQAKRLYRDHEAVVQPTWNASFAINLEQRRALQQQTEASVYFFHGPPLGGRGVPVIPTQLVADLSEHQGSGSQLARSTVASASRSLADWLTYDALALRVGDPYAALVAKAEGRPGSLPRTLLELPTVEVEITVTKRDGER